MARQLPSFHDLNPVARVRQFVWDLPPGEQKPAMRAAIYASRISWVILRDLTAGRANQQAMSLVYTTLLAIVPVLAITFAILKAFGVQNNVAELMLEFLAPLGDQGVELTERMLSFVEQVNISVLGSVGMAFFVYTLLSTMQKIERAFNDIWHVRAGRSLARQVAEFVSVGLLGPLALFLALGIIATALSSQVVDDVSAVVPLRAVIDQIAIIMPYVVMIGMFTLLYKVVPNARVRFTAALLGGAVAGLIWVATGWAFANFIVTSARYAAIYSAFASLVFFMIWLYAAWLILLTGCSVAYYFQNVRYLSPQLGVARLTLRDTDRITLALLVVVHRAFRQGGRAWPMEALARRLNIPTGMLDDIIHPLQKAGFIAISEDGRHVLAARDAAASYVEEAIQTVRDDLQAGAIASMALRSESAVDELFDRLDAARKEELSHTETIAALLEEADGKKKAAE